MNIQEFIKAKEEEFEKQFGGEGVIAKTDENCILIGFTKKEVKHFLSQSLLEYNEKIKEMCEQFIEEEKSAKPASEIEQVDENASVYAYRRIITNLTQDTNPKE